jgi:hypothetical protein
MNVVVLQVFVSLVLVAGSLILFVHSIRQRDHEHADRLSLVPLEDEPMTQVQTAQLAPAVHSTTKESSKETVCRRDA